MHILPLVGAMAAPFECVCVSAVTCGGQIAAPPPEPDRSTNNAIARTAHHSIPRGFYCDRSRSIFGLTAAANASSSIVSLSANEKSSNV